MSRHGFGKKKRDLTNDQFDDDDNDNLTNYVESLDIDRTDDNEYDIDDIDAINADPELTSAILMSMLDANKRERKQLNRKSGTTQETEDDESDGTSSKDDNVEDLDNTDADSPIVSRARIIHRLAQDSGDTENRSTRVNTRGSRGRGSTRRGARGVRNVGYGTGRGARRSWHSSSRFHRNGAASPRVGTGDADTENDENNGTSGNSRQSTENRNHQSGVGTGRVTSQRPAFLGFVTPSGQIVPDPQQEPQMMGPVYARQSMPVRPLYDENADAENTTENNDESKNSSGIKEEDIFEKDVNPWFPQPVNIEHTVDYVGLCDQIGAKVSHVISGFEKSNSLSESVNETPVNSNTMSELQTVLDDVKRVRNKLKQLVDIGKAYNKRDVMLGAFCNTAANFVGIHPSTKGEYDRKSLEASRALESLFGDSVFGNPIGSPIHFVFSHTDPTDFMSFMDTLKRTTEFSEENRLVFGVYRLDKIYREDHTIRTARDVTHICYTMIMTDIETNLSIKCFAVNNIDTANVRVQSLDYSGAHIFDAIPDLVLRRVVHVDNLTKYIKKLTTTMPRERREVIWEHILLVLEKDIQYLNQGYRCLDIGDNKMLKISTEEKEPCVITMINPPYLKLHLACGHDLSIMAVYGIVYKGRSEDTESIVCPQCRRNLIPKLVPALSEEDLKKFTVKTYKESDLKLTISTSEFKFEEDAQTKNLIKNNQEQEAFIDGLFSKKKDDESDNDDDDDNLYDDDDIQMANTAFMQYIGSMLMGGQH